MNDVVRAHQKPETLSTIAKLITSLHSRKIRYVHWKSNINIDRALAGIDDLDLLVHPGDAAEFHRLIDEIGFQRALTVKDDWQPHMYHYYCPDRRTRKMVHLHLHYALTLGYDYHKNFTLPILDWYLRDRRRTRSIYLPRPEQEYVVFTIRLLIKHARSVALVEFPLPQLKRLLKRQAGSRGGRLSQNEINEFNTLAALVDRQRLQTVLDEIGIPELDSSTFARYENAIRRAISDGTGIYASAAALKGALHAYRSSGEARSMALSWGRLNRQRAVRLAARLHVIHARGKQSGSGGRIVAFIGGDGAGKSTNVQALRNSLSDAFTARAIHVGRPSRSVRAFGLSAAARVAGMIRLGRTHSTLRNLALALNRNSAFHRAERIRDRGGIAVLDRLPHPNIKHMDGPRIGEGVGPLGRRAADYERKLYKHITGADLVIVLRLDPEIALQRRPEDDPTVLRERSGEVWSKEWTGKGIFAIDTGINAADEVKGAALDRAWQSIRETRTRCEIVGLSGSGKTSVVTALEGENPNLRRSLPYKRFPLILLAAVIEEAVRGKFPRSRLDARISKNLIQLRWFVKMATKIRTKDVRLMSHNYLLDQGPVFQLALAVREGRVSVQDKLFTQTIAAVSRWLGTGVIVLQSPVQLLRDRVENRADLTRSKVLPADQVEQFYEDYEAALEVVLRELETVSRVRSDRDLSAVANDVQDVLEHRGAHD